MATQWNCENANYNGDKKKLQLSKIVDAQMKCFFLHALVNISFRLSAISKVRIPRLQTANWLSRPVMALRFLKNLEPASCRLEAWAKVWGFDVKSLFLLAVTLNADPQGGCLFICIIDNRRRGANLISSRWGQASKVGGVFFRDTESIPRVGSNRTYFIVYYIQYINPFFLKYT